MFCHIFSNVSAILHKREHFCQLSDHPLHLKSAYSVDVKAVVFHDVEERCIIIMINPCKLHLISLWLILLFVWHSVKFACMIIFTYLKYCISKCGLYCFFLS